MTTKTGSNQYERGLELAEAGRYEQGWNSLREYLRGAPQDAGALNDAGAILHCLGRTDEAIGLLTKARQLKADDAQIVGNLAETYLGGGRAVEAVRLFDDMERAGTLSIDILNRTATMLLDQDRKGPALEVLLRSQRLWPEQEILPPILDVIRGKRPKVAFFPRDAGAAAHGRTHRLRAATLPDPVLRRPRPGGGRRNDGVERYCVVLWRRRDGRRGIAAGRREEGDPDAVGDAREPRIVVSVHRSDVRDRWAQDVLWENVDVLAPIGSRAVEEALLQQTPDLCRRTRIAAVPHGVNLRRYVLRRRDRGKHLACIGCLTMEANPAFLLQCMQKLHYLDPGYKLFFSGAFESPMLEQYVRHMVRTLDLTEVVFFEPHPRDLNAWLSDKHFVVAGGIGANQVENLLAAMACGLKPVIHNFPGAAELLGPAYLFNIAEQFCEQVLSGDYQPRQYRRLVEQRYPLEQQLKRIDDILAQMETELDQQTMAKGQETTTAPGRPEGPAAEDRMRQA